MFHNVCNMSNLTTPKSLGRGVVIPGIYTKPSLEHAATALSYGGLQTPPQSAHESRRPSLQQSAMLKVPFPGSPPSLAYSNPTTPVEGAIQHSDQMVQGWSISTITHSDPVISGTVSCESNQLIELDLRPPFAPGSSTVVDTTFQTPSRRSDTDGFELGMASELSSAETWRPSHQIMNGYDSQSACLGSTLFPPNNLDAMCVPHHESYGHFTSLSQAPPIYVPSPMTNVHEYHNISAVYQQPPQVVVPSQLSPDNVYTPANLDSYANDHDHSSVLTSSIGTVTPDILDYEMMDPSSPVEAYFAHSDSEDYIEVMPERPVTPSTNRGWNNDPISLPIHPKRRSAKRSRNGSKAPAWHSHVSHGCHVQYKGSGWGLDTDGKIQVEPATSTKVHECKFVNADGARCGRRFERSEHLKRHAGSHSNERKYPCPLDGCGKRIQRPDNAGDHFKTHLRPKKTGKRNAHVEWPLLEASIERTYTDTKQSKKLLDGLRRWIDNGMPDNTGSRKKD